MLKETIEASIGGTTCPDGGHAGPGAGGWPGFFELDHDLHILSWNHWMEMSSGVFAHEAVGWVISDLFPEVTESSLQEEISALFVAGMTEGSTIQGLILPLRERKTGRRIHQIMHLQVLREDRDSVCRIHLAPISEQAAKSVQTDVRPLLESVACGAFAIDASGAVRDCNDAAIQIIGKSKKSISGNRLEDVLPGLDLSRGPGQFELSLSAGGRERIIEASIGRLSSMDTLGGIVLIRDISDVRLEERRLREAHDRMVHLAMHDPLTGVANRRMFHETLVREIAAAKRSLQNIAVIFIDLDGFKPVNDRFGHEAGDKVLIEVARRLTRSTRSGDMVGRLGGDEFALMLKNVRDRKSLEGVTGKILESMRVSLNVTGGVAEISASIGVAVFPDDASEAEALIVAADGAMYQAKSEGKNVVTFC